MLNLLFYFILFYFILFYFILFYFILLYFILFYSILFYFIFFGIFRRIFVEQVSFKTIFICLLIRLTYLAIDTNNIKQSRC